MKFQIGDLVVLKHTETEGKISGIENNEMYRVIIDGVEIPVFKENLDHPYFDWFTKEREKKKNLKFVAAAQIPVEKDSYSRQIEMGVFLAFFPVYGGTNNEEVIKFRVYLINQDKEPVYFSYKQSLHTKTQFSLKGGHTFAFANFYIHDIQMDEMHLTPGFDLKIGYDKQKASQHFIQQEIKVRPKKLFEYLSQLQEGTLAYFQIPLEIDFISKMDIINQQEISIGYDKTVNNPILNIPKYVREIDLHIEKLQSNFKYMSNAEIIQIQLQYFEEALAKAIQNGQSDLTVIHGVGKGVLKEEIHKILNAEIHVRHFICDWSPKYGNGATQVFFNV